LPPGADAVVVQEDTTASGDQVEVRESVYVGRHVRSAGTDFNKGDVLLKKGRRLTARDIGIAAAMNTPWLRVTRRPRIAILATGDEVVMPGEPIGPTQIVRSNSLSLSAFVTAAQMVHLGIAPDDLGVLQRMAVAATSADLLVTSGGASVGETRPRAKALNAAGMELDFWKIAMRRANPLNDASAPHRFSDYRKSVSARSGSLCFCIRRSTRCSVDSIGSAKRDSHPGPTCRRIGREDYLRARGLDSAGRPVYALPNRRLHAVLMAQADCLIVRPIGSRDQAGAAVRLCCLLAARCRSNWRGTARQSRTCDWVAGISLQTRNQFLNEPFTARALQPELKA
jgi:molybdopterin molybdotransferase